MTGTSVSRVYDPRHERTPRGRIRWEASQDLISCEQLLLYDSNVPTGFFHTFMVPNQRNSHLFPSNGHTSLAGCVTCEDRIHSNMASLRDFRRQLGRHNICAFPADYRLYTITKGATGAISLYYLEKPFPYYLLCSRIVPKNSNVEMNAQLTLEQHGF